ncbi:MULTISPECIES: FadR/GntR family transcriptional regulator [Brevundimonas]|mgnify:FL=1|jgi:DNA-binding FadR family transcriptional regulator|uniref:FadR/GntR family transcriptional regulator n=1 Tax=Brevundimonas TaxID=41275 RepID=UPI000E0A0012|nr:MULTISPECIES: FCD domain-containing protein [Brevundimonas]NWE52488.1 FadR family transcriptional regulator [Brevundimonas sp. P7753]WQE36926.1 FCD domain-containing protein [Brevundimonas bullata]
MSQKRLFHAVADQILQLIADEGFGPGAKLPGERELAERFGVSRVTVREAEVALQAQGKLAIKTGSGVFVCSTPQKADALPSVSPFEVTEARSLFESEAAALAASVITDEALARLDYLVEAMGGTNPELDPDAADREFHRLIAASANNAAVLHTIETLWRMRTEQPAVSAAHQAVCEIDDSSRVEEHAAILNALKARDPAAARRAMRTHFNRLLAAMLDASAASALQALERQMAASRERFLISTHSV